ncbi:tripartite tricarboxylate transporter substrate binding protein [Belnapia sp. T6]|uniref:Tripartite tricarboxylate transporter substrate binding protein n=1 Tax=Belnapia mucosa TaxID=2804532 RepID=A0ABS1V5W2_9PROT|nr:tripartite tricarboxylate transporter substrate binding protein [Belnapia mucosa]MBL6457079.1 tripartite tricarboxylate transporter substrate binding protein [Belnapia mucosa]
MLPRRAVLALPFLASAASAQDWPGRPIRIVVPFPPGGSTDLLGRRVAEKLSPALGVPVVLENRPGAGGTTGSEMVARAAPDGTTLLFGVTGTHGVAPSLFPRLGYDPLRDFAPVSLVVTAPLVLVTRPDLPARTLAEFIALAKSEPGAITYGTPGNGTSMHLTGVMFDMQAGTRLTHVPYRGSGPALNDLVAGNLATMFGDLLVVLPQLRAGTIRAIAVTGATRHPLLPDVPTIAEAGLPGFLALSWQGLFAPAGTPRAIIERLVIEVRSALAAPELRDFFAGQGFAIEVGSPEELRSLLETEIPKWAAVVKAGQVRLD